jgi:uncharacterized membrane protein YgcG
VGTGKLLCKTVDVVEVAVRFVFVFLVEFISVESLIVKVSRIAGRSMSGSSGSGSGSSSSSGGGGGGGGGGFGSMWTGS